MNRTVKICIYAALVLCAVIFAYCFSVENAKVTDQIAGASRSRMMSYAAGFFVMLVGIGLLVAYDVSHFVGQQAQDFIFNEDLEGNYDPEYEKAEQVWADGHHLEAISLMREYLKKHPREIHAALRIAEIYEQNLRNPLAAALEYEEILKHSLPRERWGWAAIHLCNLYSKLKQTDKAVALLRRIDAEYGETAAAKKARERLEHLGPETEAEPIDEPSSSAPDKSSTAPSAPGLPPGFRPKK